MSINSDLLYSASTGSPHDLIELHSRGADLNYADPECGNTALYNAVISNRPEIVKCLLQLGADPNHRINYRSPVSGNLQREILASFVAKSEEIVKTLANAGLDVNARCAEGFTALHHACTLGASGNAVVATLIQCGADATIKTRNGRSCVDIVKTQIERIEDWRVPGNTGMIDEKIAYLRERLDTLDSQSNQRDKDARG